MNAEVPEDIRLSIERADVYQRLDIETMTLIMYSQNRKEPLTDSEKERIRNYLKITMFPYEVEFK